MKNKAFLISAAFFLLVIAGVAIYTKYFEKAEVSVWHIIPQQAVLVYESGECENCRNELNGNSLWKPIGKILGRGNSADLFSGIVADITQGATWVASLHIIQKDNFDMVFYKTGAYLNDLTVQSENWKKFTGSKFSIREFSGFSINELTFNDRSFSWVVIDNFWAGSFTSFLIEDVIRTYRSEGMESFNRKNAGVLKLPHVQNDPGNIYIDYEGLNSLLNCFVEAGDLKLPAGQFSLLDIKTGTSLSLNGFSIPGPDKHGSLLSYFNRQRPVPFTHKQYISNRTLLAANYGIDDGGLFFKQLPLSGDYSVRDSLKTLADIDFEKLFSALGKEISICTLEKRKSETARVVLFDVSDLRLWGTAFDRLSKATERNDTLYLERYGEYELRKIDLYNLPEKLFRPLVTGLKQTYYTVTGNTFILADNPVELKRYLDDIDQEEVWGKSVSANQFLEGTLLESNASFYFNTPLLINRLTHNATPYWKNFFKDNPALFSEYGAGAVQFSNLNEMFYTHVVVTSQNIGLPGKASAGTPSRVHSILPASVKSPLFIVRNHATKRNELVLQDSLHTLRCLSSDGKELWNVSLNSRLAGNIEQVDYFNNGKLQLFFATQDNLHIIDRLGNYVNPYPVSIPVRQPEFTGVIDYDNSKRYRFMVSDQAGKIWLFDKHGQQLDGWKPRNTDDNLLVPTRHYRIQGRDYIVALRQDGKVYVMNRKGELINGFPLNLDVRPSGSLYFEPGRDVSTSLFTCVSKDGVKVQFSVSGKIISREPLVKISVGDQFSLIEEESSKGYLVARQSAKRLTLLDEEGRETVVNDFVGMNRISVQYYDFGSGKVYIVIHDLTQELCYVYDGQGNALTAAPIEATAVSVGWDGEARMYVANGKTLTIELL